MSKLGKCDCCGDVERVWDYNGSNSCKKCLGMDWQGVSRKEILEEIVGDNNGNRLRRNWKKDRSPRS